MTYQLCWFLVLLLSFSCSQPGFKSVDIERVPSGSRAINSYESKSPDEIDNSYKIDELIELVHSQNINTIEKLLKAISYSKDPRAIELLENYNLVYKSHGKFKARLFTPRVILHTKDSSLIISYSTHPKDPLYQHLETIQFRAKSKKFEFRNLVFSKSGLEVSRANPSLCMGCHRGPDPRPNWDRYPFWPGLYGSDDDAVGYNKAEMAGAKYLVKYSDRLARFKWLRDFEKHYNPVVHGLSVGRSKVENNIEFTESLFLLNRMRIARILTESKYHYQTKYLLMGIVKCGIQYLPEEIADYLPANYKKTRIGKKITKLIKKLSEHRYSSESHHRAQTMMLLINIIYPDHLLSGSIKTWSMSFFKKPRSTIFIGEDGRDNYADWVNGNGGYPVVTFDKVLSQSDPKLGKFSCEELAAKSRTSITTQFLKK